MGNVAMRFWRFPLTVTFFQNIPLIMRCALGAFCTHVLQSLTHTSSLLDRSHSKNSSKLLKRCDAMWWKIVVGVPTTTKMHTLGSRRAYPYSTFRLQRPFPSENSTNMSELRMQWRSAYAKRLHSSTSTSN